MAAPKGNQFAAKAKQWSAAIERALEKRGEGKGKSRAEVLAEMADKLLTECEEGNLMALKELGDRLDGKPAQAIIGEEDNPLKVITRIERVIIDKHGTKD